MSSLLKAALYVVWTQSVFSQDCVDQMAQIYPNVNNNACEYLCINPFDQTDSTSYDVTTRTLDELILACPHIQTVIDLYGSTACSLDTLAWPNISNPMTCGCPYCPCEFNINDVPDYFESQVYFTKSCTQCTCQSDGGRICSNLYSVSNAYEWDQFTCNAEITCSSSDPNSTSTYSPGDVWWESITYDSSCQTFCYCETDGTAYCETSYADIVSSSHPGLRSAYFESGDSCRESIGCVNEPSLLARGGESDCDCPVCTCPSSNATEYIEFTETPGKSIDFAAFSEGSDSTYCFSCTCVDNKRVCDDSVYPDPYAIGSETCPPASVATCRSGSSNSTSVAKAELSTGTCYGQDAYCGWSHMSWVDDTGNAINYEGLDTKYDWHCQPRIFCEAFQIEDGACFKMNLDTGMHMNGMFGCSLNPSEQMMGGWYNGIGSINYQMCCSGSNCNNQDIDISTCTQNTDITNWMESRTQCFYGDASPYQSWTCPSEGAITCQDLQALGTWWFGCECTSLSYVYARLGTEGQTFFDEATAAKLTQLDEWNTKFNCTNNAFTCDLSTGVLSLNGVAVTPVEPTTAPTNPTPAPTSPNNCSALHAFVEVRGTGIENNLKTLTSAQALFPPYNYNPVSYRRLVTLPVRELCNPNATLSVDLTDKVVLLFEGFDDCTVHFKVSVAEQNGASAVLVAPQHVTAIVEEITGEWDMNETINTTIPTRRITGQDGAALFNELMADGAVDAQFACFDVEYPTELCVLAPPSADMHFDNFAGTYQRQETPIINGHPTWKLDGIPWIKDDIYLFLHHAYGVEPWYWAASYWDRTTDYPEGRDMYLRCGAGGEIVPDPSQCPVWLVTEEWNTTDKEWISESVNVSDGACTWTIEAQTLCVSSSTYSLAGVSGTYAAITPGASFWDRQLSDCDYAAGSVEYIEEGHYGTHYFILLDPHNWWIIALCMIPQDQIDDEMTAQWRPDLCDEWYTRNDEDLAYSASHRYLDDTFSVSIGACSTSAECVHSDPPDVVCLANNSVMHGLAMGEYVKLDTAGEVFDSPIYKRITYTDALHPLGSEALYIWYANEAWAPLEGGGWGDNIHYRQWVMNRYSPAETIEAELRGEELYDEYGHCVGWAGGNPFDCKGWVFWAEADTHYWNSWNDQYHYDEKMTITEGNCNASPFPSVPGADEWPQYICIEFGVVNASSAWADNWLSSVHRDDLIGAFVLDTSVLDDTHPIPEWIKGENDFVASPMWIIFDVWWKIIKVNETGDVSWIWCDAYSASIMNPIDCTTWYDRDWNVLDNIRFYECSADDVLTVTVNITDYGFSSTTVDSEEKQAKKDSSGAVVGTVIGIVVGVIFCLVLVLLLWKCKKDKSHDAVRVEETELADTTDNKEKRKENYDMRALNTDEEL